LDPLSGLFIATLLFRRMLDYDPAEIRAIRNKLRWSDNCRRYNGDPSKRAARIARQRRHYETHKRQRSQASLKCYYTRLGKDMPGDTTPSKEKLEAKQSVIQFYLHRDLSHKDEI